MSRPVQVALRSRVTSLTSSISRSVLARSGHRALLRPPRCRQWNAIDPPSRTITTLGPRQHGDVRKVRFVTASRLGTYALYALCISVILNTCVNSLLRILDDLPEVPDDDDDDENTEVVKDTDGKDVVIRKLLVIPLTWPRELPRRFYKGSDPEWQAYAKLGKSRQQRDALTKHVIDKIAGRVAEDRRILALIGGRKQIKLGKYMLDITFPYGPPKEYERTILLVHDGGIATATQGVSNEYYARLSRTMWPVDTVRAAKVFFNALGDYHWIRLKQAFGYEVKEGTAEHNLQQFANNVEKRWEADRKKGNGLHGFHTEGNRHVKLQRPASNDEPPADDDLARAWWLPPFSRQWITRIQIAMFSAWGVVRDTSRKMPAQPPNGTVVVTGLIEATGQIGGATLYVKAFCDPEKGHCDHLAMHVSSFKRWRQNPLQGR